MQERGSDVQDRGAVEDLSAANTAAGGEEDPIRGMMSSAGDGLLSVVGDHHHRRPLGKDAEQLADPCVDLQVGLVDDLPHRLRAPGAELGAMAPVQSDVAGEIDRSEIDGEEHSLHGGEELPRDPKVELVLEEDLLDSRLVVEQGRFAIRIVESSQKLFQL